MNKKIKFISTAILLAYAFSSACAAESAKQQLNTASGNLSFKAPAVDPTYAIGSHSSSSRARTAVYKNPDTSVILQGFHWESHIPGNWWGIVAAKAGEIGQAGFDMIWLPPSGQSASDEGYIPVRLFNQNSRYGTMQQLKSAITALHASGLAVIGDTVLNHRVGSSGWGDFTDPQWGPEAVSSGDEWSGARGRADTGAGCSFARDIDHTQPYVQDSIKEWMNWLKNEIGYDGWRFDFVRGFAGSYVALYHGATQPAISIGEYWDNLDINNPNPNRQQICNWLDSAGGVSTAFDFTTKGMLQHAVGSNEYWRLRDAENKPVGLIGWWPAKAVTFLDNHDTGPSPGGGQNHWPFPGDKIMQGYAYIITHPGIPCVYWPHFYDWGLKTEITALIQFRKSNGIRSTSKVSIIIADNSKYAAKIDDRVVVKIGPGNWNPGSDWTLALSGKDYAIWKK